MALPIGQEVVATAPATVANLGPGFDILGLALAGPSDTVRARLISGDKVKISAVTGTTVSLPLDAEKNTAGIAAMATLAKAGVQAGVELQVHKGLPIGSGLGSSAASAAAAAYAVNLLIGSPMRKADLVEPCIQAETAVSGRHADNVAPALLGGLVLVRSVDPVDLVRIPVPECLMVVVATPDFELPTRKAREVLPEMMPLRAGIQNAANLATFTAACFSNDLGLIGRCIDENVVTDARSPLVPGCQAVMSAARHAGALGSGISGAGPSIFSFCHSVPMAEQVGEAMVQTFAEVDLKASTVISSADCPGARRA